MKKYWKAGLIILAALLAALAVVRVVRPPVAGRRVHRVRQRQVDASRPDIDVELLTVNPYSRPGDATGRINGIVIHYTANPGSTAIDNRNYFEGLKDSHETQASSNFIVGLGRGDRPVCAYLGGGLRLQLQEYRHSVPSSAAILMSRGIQRCHLPLHGAAHRLALPEVRAG